jgi:hypothetical protein
MYGKGLLKGLGVTFKRFWITYWDDLLWFLGRIGGQNTNTPKRSW